MLYFAVAVQTLLSTVTILVSHAGHFSDVLTFTKTPIIWNAFNYKIVKMNVFQNLSLENFETESAPHGRAYNIFPAR